MNPHPDPGPIPAGPSLRAPIVATVVLMSLWATFTLFAWPLAGPIGALADRVEVGLGLDVNAGKPKKDEVKPEDTVPKKPEGPKTLSPRPP